MSTVGLESKTEEVWRWVMNESVMTIGIQGEGGVGKTTLLKLIYNRLTSFPRYFDIVIWVTVSQNLSLEKVQDDIWKKIGVLNVEWVDKSSEEKAKAIHDALSKKKCVLLLDDLGEPLDLRKVGIVEPEEKDKSNQMLILDDLVEPLNLRRVGIAKPEEKDELNQMFLLESLGEPLNSKVGIVESEDEDEFQRFLLDCLGEPLPSPSFTIREPLYSKVGIVESEEKDKSLGLRKVGIVDPGNNCKIIFTTRSLEVCRQMGAQATEEIKSLEWEHAWELFKKMVGEDKLCDQKLMELAQLIARTCQGLPLLLRTVGRAMASKKTYEEWQAAIKGMHFEVAKEGGKERVSFLLNLCFQSLDWCTRSCLLSFSLFPEDFTIPKNELIDFWICQQVIRHGNSKEHDDVLNLGYKTVDALVGACLLEEDEFNSVKLLDLIRDFALGMDSWPGISKMNPSYRRRIMSFKKYRRGNMGIGWVLQMRTSIRSLIANSESFLAFLLNHNPIVMLTEAGYKHNSVSLDQGFPKHGKKHLTVLDLSSCGVEEIPPEVADLDSLNYLNLSHTWIEHLPVEMKKLVNLKCLNLEYNELLRVVPNQLISGLLNLEVLKLFRCSYSVEEVKDNMLSASHMDIEPVLSLDRLKVLSISVTCLSALQKLFSNHKLLSCTQSLSLEVFWGVKLLDISAIAVMKNLLTFEIHQVEGLKQLNGFWHLIRENSFERLKEITFEKCSSLTELTWVVLVQNLTVFTVKDCEEIEEIVSTRRLEGICNGQDLEPFSKLEVVVLESLPKLESIYGKALPFQQLKKMVVMDCYMLKKLPLKSTSAKASKVVIETEENWWNDIKWEDDDAKGIFSPCFKPVDDEF